ncbi:MAG TPA: hypothetical protein VKF81_05080 [Blastocatellia bacterium]|nr:hypothetical protein [Blastocatellia bacterium]
MKPLRVALFLVLAFSFLSLALHVEAQTKPNVSGTWKMNAERSRFERGGPKAITIKLDQQGSTLNESLTLTNDQGERTESFTYTLDGKESVLRIEGEQIKATAVWDGASLVLEFKNDEGLSFRRKITVSADGKTMTIDVKQSNPNGTTNDTVILEKQ